MTSQLTIPTRDGRTLDVYVDGPDDGIPLVFHNGTPGSGRLYPPFVAAAGERGLRMLSFSRPGYGGSTRNPGRSVADVADDVATVVDHLGGDRFYTMGWSGGGPHTLACASLLPDRVRGAATIGGVAPFTAEGLDWMAGMGRENIEEFGAALAGNPELQAFLERDGAWVATVTAPEIAAAFGDLVSQVDRDALSGEYAAWLADGLHEAVRNGIWGWFDDDIAFVKPWGFELDAIHIPVAIWQGAQDRMVPFAHGEWLAAKVPGARAHLLADHGHLSLGVASFPDLLDDLLEIAPR